MQVCRIQLFKINVKYRTEQNNKITDVSQGNRWEEIDNILDILFFSEWDLRIIPGRFKRIQTVILKIRPVRKRSHSNDIIFMPKRYKDFMKQAVIEPYVGFRYLMM